MLSAEASPSYYRARYYDSSLARFLNEDRIGLNGGLNLYAYVDNDPQNYIDPFGLRKYKCDLMGNCLHLPSGSHRRPPMPNSAGSIIVDQQLNAYRDCVAAGVKGINDPPPRPSDPFHGILKAVSNTMKPKSMPGDPSGPFAFPNPRPNTLGAEDGLAVVDDLTRRSNSCKRARVADNCADRFPLAKLSTDF